MTMGPDAAKVTVIEYASATCPHCAAFYNETFLTLKKEYIDTGKISSSSANFRTRTRPLRPSCWRAARPRKNISR